MTGPGARVTAAGALAAAVVVVVVVVAVVAGVPLAAGLRVDPAAGAAEPAPPPIAWHACRSAGYQCATVLVPVDYRRRSASIALAVVRRPATGERLGSLFMNPGGPGESGVLILPVLAALLPSAVTDHFDLVSFDERGTGSSSRLACGPPPAAFADALPVPAPGSALPGTPLFEALARQCARDDPTILRSVDTTNSARDMDRIRQALGEATISYYGLSYGTVLGSVYAHLFPGRVRAMVLDGAVDATVPLARQAAAEAPAIEASLRHLLSSCTGPGCPLGPHPIADYERLWSRLLAHPLAGPTGSSAYPVTAGDLATATLYALSVPTFAPGFPAALAAAGRGDGAPLRALSLGLWEDLDGGSLAGALWAITCNDAARHPSPVAAGALARSLAARYPLDGVDAVANNLEGCLGWPAAARPITSIRVTAGPPVMVIGNTGDPNTPHAGAAQLARALGTGRLVTWRGWGHTWLLNGHTDTCMARAVSAYLVGRAAPAAGLSCA